MHPRTLPCLGRQRKDVLYRALTKLSIWPRPWLILVTCRLDAGIDSRRPARAQGPTACDGATLLGVDISRRKRPDSADTAKYGLTRYYQIVVPSCGGWMVSVRGLVGVIGGQLYSCKGIRGRIVIAQHVVVDIDELL